ncbi:MAG: OmpA family protein [Bacteroidota bacterium]
MNISSKIIVTFVVTLVFSVNVMAQKNFSVEADNAFKNKQYFNAIELYKKAYTKAKKKEDKANIIFTIAECYRLTGDSKQAEAWYIKAIKANYTDPKAKLYLADAKKAQEKYNEALIEYTNYQTEAPSDRRGEDGIKSCELATKWKENPTRYKVENMTLINSKDPDFCPTYADKKYNKLYFTSMRPGVTGGAFDGTLGEFYSDIFETQMDKNGRWSTPAPLPPPVNTEDNEGLSTITKKGDMLVFTRCVSAKNANSLNQLWFSVKKGNVWGEPEKVAFCNDTTKYASPSISSGGTILIFSSDMPGGQGENDLWMSNFNKKEKKWEAPVNLGANVNTAGNDLFPFLHDDGTLYFSSDAHLGMGGMDIFKAEKKGKGEWTNVTNLKYPINSAGDDFGIIFEGAKERGYLSSNREGTKGSDDIWSFVLPPLLFSVTGTVNDAKSKEPVEGVVIKLKGSDGSLVETKTDAEGKYTFAANGNARYINPNTSYEITTQVGNDIVTKKAPNGFVNSSAKSKVTTVGVEEAKTFKGLNFSLVPIEKEIRFPDVLYDLGQSTLRPESQDSLNFLYETLIDNPTFIIELSAHTDSRGGDPDNLKLSEARAKSCFDYLVSKGIPAERMVPKGYGEKRLLVTDPEINKLGTTQEKEAGHQKNRRTVFSVLRKDYVNPNAPKVAPKTQQKPKTEEEEEEEE